MTSARNAAVKVNFRTHDPLAIGMLIQVCSITASITDLNIDIITALSKMKRVKHSFSFRAKKVEAKN